MAWLYGLGQLTATDGEAHPDLGKAQGVATRDSEIVVWDGFRLMPWPETVMTGEPWSDGIPAVMPTARTESIAKTPTAQRSGDIAIADRIAVVAWINETVDKVYISVYDPTSWAPRMVEVPLSPTSVLQVRCVPAGEWVHVLVATAAELTMWSIHASDPTNVLEGATELGTCDTYFDARRLTDTLWAVVKRDTDETIKLTYLNADGSTNRTYCSANTSLVTTAAAENVAFDRHPQTEELCVAWNDSGSTSILARVYNSNGDSASSELSLTALDGGLGYISVACTYSLVEDGDSHFHVYYSRDNESATPPTTWRYDVNRTAGASESAKRFYGELASHSFRVGDSTFALLKNTYPATATTELQYTYFLCDQNLKPVGMLERFTAAATPMVGLPSVHFNAGQGTMNKITFHSLLVRRTRVDSADNDQWDEESLKRIEYDFLPKLRSAQLGRTTYFAGAQVNAYDGREVVEAGFHLAIENVDVDAHADAGNLNGTYQYRIRPAYKNAQGEEIVGPAITTAVSGSIVSKKGDLAWPSYSWTRREEVYFLVFRRAAAGTSYFLVSSRDLTDNSGDNCCPLNDKTAETITFVDNLSDADLISREQDRGDSGLLEPFSGSSCEVIAAGRDRLWLAGGELERGSVLPSLLYAPDSYVQTAEFNIFLNTPVDRGYAPITGVGFMGNSTIVFKKDTMYSFEADGPSNLGAGVFDYPRVIAADVGARSQEGIVLTTAGLVFPSTSGIKMLATNYQVVDIGNPVRDIASIADLSCGILVSRDQELRFYSTDQPALVFNYRVGEWATWPGVTAVGAALASDGLVGLAKADGRFWKEAEDVWTDDSHSYTFLVQTAWLHPGILQGAQRVRKVALLGDMLGEHTLHCRAYYDDRDFPEDQWTWTPYDGDLNDSEWGDDDWGDGLWGDSEADTTFVTPIRDHVYTHQRGLARQRCARISLRFSDGGARSEGPAFTALALEVGRRGGLTPTPTRTFDT